MRFFVAILCAMALLGWFVHRDYGLSWDEPIVLEYGHQILAYLQDGDPAFSKTFDRYHGSFPPLWMAAVDSFFSEASTQERYFWIRKINFSFYLLGGTLLGLLARKTWGNKEGCLILVLWLLSPRIFADAFYNTKDIPFLSLSILCTWTGLRFIQKRDGCTLLFHACSTALLMNTRILGVLVLLYTAIFLVRSWRSLLIFCGYGLFSILFLWALWPILWIQGPLGIWEAVSHMSHFPWKGEVLYMGESIQAEHLPWHYPFVWMGVTIPIVYLVLAGFGLMNREIREDKTHMWILLTGIFPVLLVTLLGSVLYDGWRHLYFVYPVFLWFSILGVRYLETRWPQRKMFIWGIGSLCLSWIGVRMIQHHPYEMVYFNALGGERSTLRARFELDYWGLGFREMLEEILRMDDRDMISVGVSNISGIYAKDILSVEGQKRIRFVGKQDKADYFMSNFRWHPEGYPLPKVFSLVVEGLELGAVYRIRIQEEEESKRGL